MIPLLTHWLAMGGYARYLWPSYGVAFAAVFVNIWWALRSARDARAQARRRIAMVTSSDGRGA